MTSVEPPDYRVSIVRAACPAPGARRRGYRPPIGVAPEALRGPGRAGAIAAARWS